MCDINNSLLMNFQSVLLKKHYFLNSILSSHITINMYIVQYFTTQVQNITKILKSHGEFAQTLGKI